MDLCAFDPLPTPRPRTPRPPLAPGQRVGAFQVLSRLGRGGSATVYRVVHAELGQEFALKVLRQDVMDEDLDAVLRFLEEARLARCARGVGVVQVYDTISLPDGRPALAMELLTGRCLRDVVRSAPLAPARAVEIARGIAQALASVHAAGVIHRDVAPGNVFVGDDGQQPVRLIDFGSAQLGIQCGPTTDTVVGTPCYMAPEHVLGRACDERADLYSLGAVLFEMLTGQPPFRGDTAYEVARGHVCAAVPAIDAANVPAWLAAVATRLLAKRPDERFESAAAVVAALSQSLRP